MLKKLLLATALIAIIIFPAFVQSCADNIPTTIEQISENNIKEYIEALEGFGTRYSFSKNSALAAEWLFNKFSEFGLWVEYQFFNYKDVIMKNVVATLNSSSEGIFIISAHYDSINVVDSVKSTNDVTTLALGG